MVDCNFDGRQPIFHPQIALSRSRVYFSGFHRHRLTDDFVSNAIGSREPSPCPFLEPSTVVAPRNTGRPPYRPKPLRVRPGQCNRRRDRTKCETYASRDECPEFSPDRQRPMWTHKRAESRAKRLLWFPPPPPSHRIGEFLR